uniref:Pectinesterase inhibitor domain-containing protein n=1 Tax=Aegilops tauschii subsp. strangulata TaxID=200361 RepID=A0A453APR1_AEGTS
MPPPTPRTKRPEAARLLLLTTFLLLLLTFLFAQSAFAADDHHDGGHHARMLLDANADADADAEHAAAVDRHCAGMLHRDVCVSTLAGIQGLARKPLGEVISKVVERAASAVRAAASNCTSYLSRPHRLRLRDRLALSDCQELFGHTLNQLGTAAAELSAGNRSAEDSISGVQTVLSAAMTNQYTCLEGFAGPSASEDGRVRPFIQGRIYHVAHLVSNSLAMVRRLPQRRRGRVRAGAARVPGVGGGGGPEAAAAAAGRRRRRAGPGGGQGRERQLHDGGGGGGGGAQQQRYAVRDPHQGRGILRERGGRGREDQHHARRRRHVEDRHQGQPQRHRQLHHLPLRHASGDRDGVPGAGPDGGERGGAGQAPGGGATGERRPVRLLPLQLRGVPGHALRALAPPVLPRLRRLRHRRFRLRRRRRRAPELQPLRAPPGPRPEERLHRAGTRGPQPEHRHRRAGLQDRCRRRPCPRAGQLLLLPRPALEDLLPDRVHAVQDGEPGAPARVARVERHLRARHALLRRVHEPGPRRQHVGEGGLAGLPGDHHRRRRRQLHRAGVHPGRPLAQLHLLPLLAGPRI